jgi:predicted ATPase
MKLDSQQILVKNELDKLASSLEEHVSKGILKKIISPKHNSLKSLYIYGGVGRGKTMLMKNFFDSLKKEKPPKR